MPEKIEIKIGKAVIFVLFYVCESGTENTCGKQVSNTRKPQPSHLRI
jgi:hypothetical protein